MAVATRATNEAAYTHLMVTIFGWSKDTTEAYKALTLEGYTNIIDITTLDEDEIDNLEYEDSGAMKKVPMKQKKLLKHALLYYDYEVNIRASGTFDADDWLATTPEAFEEFRQTKVPLLLRSKGSGRGTSTSVVTTGVT